MLNHFATILLSLILLASCSNSLPIFKSVEQPKAPDYSNSNHWSALPFRNDAADAHPKNELWRHDSLKTVDVFYVYPTLYAKGNTWNADLNNRKLNKLIDKYPVRYHASAFNHIGRVYVPRYRQAIIDSYAETSEDGKKALDFAYADVKQAFEYYLQHYNNGRPIIIASHSQGSTHSRQLIKDFFDSPQSKKQLVCAYIIGIAMDAEQFETLKICENADETNCYVTWSTFKEGYDFKGKYLNKKLKVPLELLVGNVVVNPVSWTTDTLNYIGKGGILLNMNRRKPFTTHTRIHENYLWVKTNMPFVRRWDNLHLLDYNLFWHNIRENAALRVEEFLKRKEQ